MTCRCIIRHATTPDERRAAHAQLEVAREVPDLATIARIVVALQECPGWPPPPAWGGGQ
jgi:hypothetical protein